jgi:hypothetical protein
LMRPLHSLNPSLLSAQDVSDVSIFAASTLVSVVPPRSLRRF